MSAGYTLAAHTPAGIPVCALAQGDDYPRLRDLLLRHPDRATHHLLILPTDRYLAHAATDRAARAALTGVTHA